MMNLKTVTIGLVAGLACTIFIALAGRMGVSGVPLMLASAVPIYFAALSWGTQAGMASSLIAIFATASLANPQFAVIIGFILTIPASIIGHQANLAQESDVNGELEWYPVSNLLFNLSAILTIGLIFTGYIIGYDDETLTLAITEFLKQFFLQNPPAKPLSDQEIADIAQSVVKILPFSLASVWLIAHTLNIKIAALLSRGFNLAPRPPEDIAATITLPRYALAIMLVGLVLSVILSGGLQHISAIVAGIFVTAFSIIGLGAFHLKMRSMSGGLGILIFTYVMIIIFYLPLLIFAVGGVLRTLNTKSTNNQTPSQSPPGN